jgi:hypothetical protein
MGKLTILGSTMYRCKLSVIRRPIEKSQSLESGLGSFADVPND